jgi:hypothetical protein
MAPAACPDFCLDLEVSGSCEAVTVLAVQPAFTFQRSAKVCSKALEARFPDGAAD